MGVTTMFILCSFQVLIKFTISMYPEKSALRVINGRDASQGEFPYAVRIELHITIKEQEKFHEKAITICSGAALASTWVLTADHCLEDANETINDNSPARLKIRYGQPHLKPSINQNIVFALKLIRPSRSFDKYITDDDIGLIYTEKMALDTFGKLNAVDYTSLIGHTVTIMGFGIMNLKDKKNSLHTYEDTLTLDKPLQIIDKALLVSCHKSFTMKLCVMPKCGTTKSAITGDSGGPVVHESGAIIGVNEMVTGLLQLLNKSTANYAIQPNTLVVTPVSPYIDWIYKHVHT